MKLSGTQSILVCRDLLRRKVKVSITNGGLSITEVANENGALELC